MDARFLIKINLVPPIKESAKVRFTVESHRSDQMSLLLLWFVLFLSFKVTNNLLKAAKPFHMFFFHMCLSKDTYLPFFVLTVNYHTGKEKFI